MMGRVAVLKAYGGDFELREYPVPDPEPLSGTGASSPTCSRWRESPRRSSRRTGCGAAATACASLTPPCR